MHPTGSLRLVYLEGRGLRTAVGGSGGTTDPVRLNDDGYLRLSVSLALVDDPDHGRRLKTLQSSYQYQHDREGKRWIWRYDYLREPGVDPYPQAHLQVNGTEVSGVDDKDLPDIHFPTGRVAIEGIARLLADQYGVKCNCEPEVWRPALATAEKAFLEIAHRPLSGPGL
jgi:hypothetical protein